MDIGMDTEFKRRLTAKDEKAVYSQNLPRRMHLKEGFGLIVELALMHKHHHSPTFFQVRKSHFRTEETQRKITSLCGSQENQQPDCR